MRSTTTTLQTAPNPSSSGVSVTLTATIAYSIPATPRVHIDYSALLYDPVYAEMGVDAMLTTTEGIFEITVIDDTRPTTQTSNTVEIRSVGPGAFARIPELTDKGIDRADYSNSMLSFNGRMWIIRSYEIRGSPNGEDLGEVRFLLRSSDD